MNSSTRTESRLNSLQPYTHPPLETPRLTLRFFDRTLPNRSDHAKIHHIYNQTNITKTPTSSGINTYEDLDIRAEKFRLPASTCHKAMPPSYPWILIYIKPTALSAQPNIGSPDSDYDAGGTFIGFVAAHSNAFTSTSLTETSKTFVARVGVSIKPEHQRYGYASEALTRLLEFCDVYLGLECISADVAHDNTASIGLMEKTNAVLAGQGSIDGHQFRRFDWNFEGWRMPSDLNKYIERH